MHEGVETMDGVDGSNKSARQLWRLPKRLPRRPEMKVFAVFGIVDSYQRVGACNFYNGCFMPLSPSKQG